MLDQESDGLNRRDAFRIDDTLKMTIRPLNEESMKAISDDFNGFRLRYCMKSHMQNQNEVRKPKLIRIKKRDSDVAEYLESLEVQIAQLAERLDETSKSTEEAIEFSGRVNLSSTGIRFRTRIPLEPGQVLEIGMVLNTLNTQVVMLGEVLRVEERVDEMIAVSVNYSHIHPEDSEAIIRHLARLQQIELQARRDVE